VHFGQFGCLTKLGAKRAEQVQKFVPRSCVGIFRNERTRSTPLDPNLMFWCVSYYLGAFGTVWLPYETRCKMGRTSAKFVPRSRVGIFRNERSRSIPVVPKLMFWCVLFNLGALRTVWLRYETRCKTGRTSAKVGATKSRRNFLQRTHPIHPIMHPIHPLDPKLMFWCVLYYFIAFGTVWLRYETRCKTGRTSAKVSATKSRRNFLQRTHPVHPIGP